MAALCFVKSWLKGLICALLIYTANRAAKPMVCLLYHGTNCHSHQGLQHLLGKDWTSGLECGGFLAMPAKRPQVKKQKSPQLNPKPVE